MKCHECNTKLVSICSTDELHFNQSVVLNKLSVETIFPVNGQWPKYLCDKNKGYVNNHENIVPSNVYFDDDRFIKTIKKEVSTLFLEPNVPHPDGVKHTNVVLHCQTRYYIDGHKILCCQCQHYPLQNHLQNNDEKDIVIEDITHIKNERVFVVCDDNIVVKEIIIVPSTKYPFDHLDKVVNNIAPSIIERLL